MPALAGGDAYDPWRDTAHYDFTYTVDVSSLGGPGSRTRLWLPLASDGPDQEVSVEVSAPLPHRLTTDAHGNHIAYLEWEGRAPGPEVTLRFAVMRRVSHGVAAADARPDTPLDPERYRRAALRIPLKGPIAALGALAAHGASDDRAKIRAFYDYVIGHMRYSKEGEGWGRGDALWACTSKYGNCTDFHSLFIGMARSQGIPARFLIGFPIPSGGDAGPVAGYHCWAEAWEGGVGWLPIDASEAWKAGTPDAYFGTLPSDRIRFSVGRDLVLEPPQAGAPLNFFVYPYAEVDGKAVERVPARFRYRRLSHASVARTP